MKRIVFCLMYFFICYVTLTLAQDNISSRHYASERKVPDSVSQKMKKSREFAYANDMRYWKDDTLRKKNALMKMLSDLSRSVALKVILYSLLIAAVIFGLYQVIVVNNFFILSGGRRNRKKSVGSDDGTINGNLDEKINEAIENKSYRHAIRYMYLKTLKVLSDNHLIILNAKFTNRDYLLQLQKHNNVKLFSKLTHIYEYVWYGELNPTETQFEAIRKNFNLFNRSS
ncbi:MAG TPA: hypothetical protein VM101_07725 [Flavitalea sp.]|nr:hypothetical protein [Flavitalea sp.]